MADQCRIRFSFRFFLVALAATLLLTPTVTRAFTFDSTGKGTDSIPKFDLEEQSRQFRTPQFDASTAGKQWETPLGKLQFGVQPADSSMYGYRSPFAPSFGATGNADRRHYERMFVHPDLQHKYD